MSSRLHFSKLLFNGKNKLCYFMILVIFALLFGIFMPNILPQLVYQSYNCLIKPQKEFGSLQISTSTEHSISRHTFYANNKYITELNEERLYQMKRDESLYIPSVIVFYASFCPQCHNSFPTYTNLAKVYSENLTSIIQFGAIDCVLYRKTCLEYNITGYPTIKLFNFPSGNIFILKSY